MNTVEENPIDTSPKLDNDGIGIASAINLVYENDCDLVFKGVTINRIKKEQVLAELGNDGRDQRPSIIEFIDTEVEKPLVIRNLLDIAHEAINCGVSLRPVTPLPHPVTPIPLGHYYRGLPASPIKFSVELRRILTQYFVISPYERVTPNRDEAVIVIRCPNESALSCPTWYKVSPAHKASGDVGDCCFNSRIVAEDLAGTRSEGGSALYAKYDIGLDEHYYSVYTFEPDDPIAEPDAQSGSDVLQLAGDL